MKYCDIQHKMLKVDMLYPILQQVFKMASLCMEKHGLSPFVNHFIDNTVCYTPDDISHTDSAPVVLSKITQNGLLVAFSYKFFHSPLC